MNIFDLRLSEITSEGEKIFLSGELAAYKTRSRGWKTISDIIPSKLEETLNQPGIDVAEETRKYVVFLVREKLLKFDLDLKTLIFRLNTTKLNEFNSIKREIQEAKSSLEQIISSNLIKEKSTRTLYDAVSDQSYLEFVLSEITRIESSFKEGLGLISRVISVIGDFNKSELVKISKKASENERELEAETIKENFTKLLRSTPDLLSSFVDLKLSNEELIEGMKSQSFFGLKK
jgi:hypothetical protein